jgi:hypothetical protein
VKEKSFSDFAAGMSDCRQMHSNIVNKVGLERCFAVVLKNIEMFSKGKGRLTRNRYFRGQHQANLVFRCSYIYISDRIKRGLITEDVATEMLHNIGIKQEVVNYGKQSNR